MTAAHENQPESQKWIPTTDTFGMRLAMIRHMKGWNAKEAALACGQPAASWREWELRDRAPRNIVEVCQKIADVTDCDWQWLLTGTASAEASPLSGLNRRPSVYNTDGLDSLDSVVNGSGHVPLGRRSCPSPRLNKLRAVTVPRTVSVIHSVHMR